MNAERGSIVVGILVAAVAAVIIGGLVFWAVTDEGTPSVGDEPAPTTSAAVLAIALEHVDQDATGEPTSVERDADARWKDSHGGRISFEGIDLEVVAAPTAPYDPCELGECRAVATDRGEAVVGWQEGGQDGPGVLFAFLDLEDQFLHVTWEGVRFEGDPREADLPISVDDLLAILADERLDLHVTTHGAFVAGEALLDEVPERSG